MIAGLAKALSLLVAIGLLLGPLAPKSANCGPANTASTAQFEIIHASAPGHDCCDEADQTGLDGAADLSKCKVGCIATPGVSLPAQSAMTLHVVEAEPSSAARGIADWLPPPLYDPPILR
ncbi:MAG: hypothetical protein KG075_19240, partial [Alphaproteobacteria bacterium]|nr:hypothetical protein [Alphaproteobacteria bacterium]